MPNPRVCNRIADPAARRRCLKYQGEFAEPGAGPAAGPGAGPGAAPRAGAGRLGRMPRRRGKGGGGNKLMSGGGGFGGGSY